MQEHLHLLPCPGHPGSTPMLEWGIQQICDRGSANLPFCDGSGSWLGTPN